MSKLIESETFVGQYNMRGTRAIVDHPTHGRLYITQGYGGEGQLRGGAMRWNHGIVIKVSPGTSLAQAAAMDPRDPAVTVEEWDGHAVAVIATQVGL